MLLFLRPHHSYRFTHDMAVRQMLFGEKNELEFLIFVLQLREILRANPHQEFDPTGDQTESDRLLCHLTIILMASYYGKHFSHDIAQTIGIFKCPHAAVDDHEATDCDQKSFIILVGWRRHQLLSHSLPNSRLSRVSQRLGLELFTLPSYTGH